MRWWNDHVEAGVRRKKRAFTVRDELKCGYQKHQNNHKNRNTMQDETKCSEEGQTEEWVKLKLGESLQKDFRQN